MTEPREGHGKHGGAETEETSNMWGAHGVRVHDLDRSFPQEWLYDQLLQES
jgi:hypothetical protein